ncbi:MAG: Holliday junction branch migration protein RuvA [Candidatus Saccharibacteria bacterium]|nr:Holliday junction branch migration protein RuvA [Candidatus Saccharibacteria bacterium]
MIATLTGIVAETESGMVVIEVGGVGYGVMVTATDQGTLPSGTQTKLFIYENIKEDAHNLIGFKQISTKKLFEQLLSVKNVGPKGALAVLDIGSDAIVRAAIAGGDVKALQSAKGVGKRAAEQIVVELRDKVGAPVGDAAEMLIGRAGVNTSDEAVQALMALGYSDYDASAALAEVDTSLSTEERITLALRKQ